MHKISYFTYISKDEIVASLLKEEAAYLYLETSLKPASRWRTQHEQELYELLKFKEFREKMERAIDLLFIELPASLTDQEWKALREKLIHSEITANSPIPQEQKGISNEIMVLIYNKGRDYLKGKNYKDAKALFTFLTYFNPQIPEYWIGLGVAVYSLEQFVEALSVFSVVKILQPDKAIGDIYLTLSHSKMGHKEEMQEHLAQVEQMIIHSDEERNLWQELYQSLHHEGHV